MPHVIDPLGGSYYVESLTNSLVVEAEKLIAEVEALGGMTKAVESGMPKLRIEEAAARRQARIDRGEDIIVGVNKYQSGLQAEVEVLDIDNSKVREQQIARLNKIKASRDAAKVTAALDALTKAAADNSGNLLELAIAAMRARATVGEVSSALEKIYSRHKAEVRSISGVYGAAYRNDPDFQTIQSDVQAFLQGGRPPAAHAGGEAGTGRSRSRRQDHRDRLRGHRLRCRHRPAVPDAGRGGAPGDRE